MTLRVGVSAAACAAAVVAVGVWAGASSGARSRVAHDPCGHNPGAHVTPHGLHCGVVFHIPGHHTWKTPKDDAPPVCPPGQGIPGAQRFSILHAKWDYWTAEGKWILWDGYSGERSQENPFAVSRIWPRFHNWGPHPWAVRVYFECAPY